MSRLRILTILRILAKCRSGRLTHLRILTILRIAAAHREPTTQLTKRREAYGDKWVDGTNGLDPTPSLMEFAKRRLASSKGMVVFDYGNRFRIELPKKADAAQPPRQLR